MSHNDTIIILKFRMFFESLGGLHTWYDCKIVSFESIEDMEYYNRCIEFLHNKFKNIEHIIFLSSEVMTYDDYIKHHLNNGCPNEYINNLLSIDDNKNKLNLICKIENDPLYKKIVQNTYYHL